MTSITTLLKKNYAELLFTDTDSLTYEVKVKSEDKSAEYLKRKHLFEVSNYPEDSKIFDPIKNKLLQKMKEVFEGKAISKICWIKIKNSFYAI